MKNNFLKIISAITLAIIVSACGGGGSGDDSQSTNEISGTAAKGIVKKGLVNIYGVTNGEKGDLLVSGKTDLNGKYKLTIENYTGPIFVEISAESDTKMVCDILPKCGDVNFGEEIDLDDEFKIKSVVGKLEKNKPITANVNILTSLVAAMVESENNINFEAISNANSQVATIFDMAGDLTSKPIVDITDPESMNEADLDAIKLSSLNSAIASSMENEISISRGLSNLGNDFVSNGGQLLNNGNDNQISLAKISEKNLEILETENFQNRDIGTLYDAVVIKKEKAEKEPEGSFTKAKPIDSVLASKIELAMEMVSNIREFSLRSTYENSEEAHVFKDLENALELYDSNELDELNHILSLASMAFREAYWDSFYYNEQQESDEPYIFEYVDYDWYTRDPIVTKIPVDITYLNNVYVLSINTSIGSINIDLKSSIQGASNHELPYDNAYPYLCDNFNNYDVYDTLFKETSNGSFSINGSLKGQTLDMNLLKGAISVSYDCSDIISESEDEDSYRSSSNSISIASLSINLDVEISKVAQDSLSFKGIMDLDIDISEDYMESISGDIVNYDEIADELDPYDPTGTIHLPNEFAYSEDYITNSNLVLSGELSSGEEKIGLTISESFKEIMSYEDDHLESLEPIVSTKEQSNPITDFDFYEILSQFPLDDLLDDDLYEENLSIYVPERDRTFGISLDLSSANIINFQGIDLLVNADVDEQIGGSLKLHLGSKSLEFEYSPNQDKYQATVTNQNGTTMKLSDQCYIEKKECENIGHIMVGDEETATVSFDTEKDIVIVNYKNGISEPLAL